MNSPIELHVKRDKAPAMVAEMARILKLPMEKDCQKSFLQLTPPFGQGFIMSYHASDGLDAVILDCRLSQPLHLTLHGPDAQPMHLFTISEGALNVKSEKGSFSLTPLQAAIHGDYGDGEYALVLPSETKVTVLMTMIHRKLFFEEIACGVLKLPAELLRVIKGSGETHQQFLYTDIFHLPAVDAVQEIVTNKDRGLLHSTHCSAMIYQNMYLLLNEYKRQSNFSNRRILRGAEKIKLIQAAEKIIGSNLQSPPTIPMLAKMVGINQQTLKNGFRQVYGMTINQYLTERRLTQASALIATGGMSIGEIADCVGYANGGYFSRKFKEKYGVAPSKFNELQES
ncbi:AraC family transcriptional regulator [Lewinella sp. 4G2]|uniref:AraC family transcriptional regulator n=1 Tax=Lewinella sp. 4G2 TaxID=1803372 RepID=UPI0007B48E55|nr:AraC family transcriptional regulator [Lewinella sp. 4G2]OAV44430.1 hypothetical protein A3850_007955 [Lewinella sp. 4G2]